MYQDELTGIYYFSEYAPYWIIKGQVRNPDFVRSRDGRMLDFKENKESAIEYYCKKLEEELYEPLKNHRDICLAVVPSHDPAKKNEGMTILGKRFIKRCGLIDATDCLNRFKLIDKLSHGGDRSIETHLNSIRVMKTEKIRGKHVILIDDVTTSGNSLVACKQLLINSGAKVVICIALAKTIH